MQDVRVIGHRGAAALAPENTLASIRKAHEVGATWVEIDVSVLRDGALVIFHDNTLERCSNGEGELEASRWDEVRDLDCGRWFAEEFANEPMPTLMDAITLIQTLGLGLNLEIKYEGQEYTRIVDPVLDTLNQHWQDRNKLIISSFNHGALLRCAELGCTFALGQLYEEIPEQWPQELAAIRAYSLHCDFTHLNARTAAAIKQAGYRLYCYTSNDPLEVARHWAWGMDGIITDNPPLFLA